MTHPSTPPVVFVHDANRDALLRRADVATQVAEPLGRVVRATPSLTGARLLPGLLPPETVALIDLYDGSRQQIERSGEPIIASCSRADLRTYAWTAHITADALAGAASSGADGVVPVLPQRAERDALRAAMVGDPSVEIGPMEFPDDAPWADWFEDEYGKSWDARMEPGLARLAETGERAALADRLQAKGVVKNREQGVPFLRELAKLIAKDRASVPSYVAEQAERVLTVIAGYRPLVDPPAAVASLEQTINRLERQPSLARAAGLSTVSLGEVRSAWQHILKKRGPRGVGSPGAGVADAELEWATNQLVSGHRLAPAASKRAAAGAASRITTSCLAVADASKDALFFPGPRVAAALLEAEALPADTLPDEVETAEGQRLRWHGRSVDELIGDEGSDDDVDPKAAAELVRELDAALAALALEEGAP